MDFTITFADALVPRIVDALGLTGTAAQKKAQAEKIIKDYLKAKVVEYEGDRSGATLRIELAAEIAEW